MFVSETEEFGLYLYINLAIIREVARDSSTSVITMIGISLIPNP